MPDPWPAHPGAPVRLVLRCWLCSPSKQAAGGDREEGSRHFQREEVRDKELADARAVLLPLPSALAQLVCGTVLDGNAGPAWEGVEGAEGRGMP